MATGDSDDILNRITRYLIPNRWFSWVAPLRDAVVGGLADNAAWCYSWIIYARLQSRLATATGVWLDIWSQDFLSNHLPRMGSTDDAFRASIKATVLQVRVTRAGMVNALTALTGNAPWIFEPWNTGDTGAYGVGTFAYGGRSAVGSGGWGNMNLPGQFFIQPVRGAGSGVPNVGGWGSIVGGYGIGLLEYFGPQLAQIGVTDANIYSIIETTKPTGVIAWTRITNQYPAVGGALGLTAQGLAQGSGMASLFRVHLTATGKAQATGRAGTAGL